MLAYKWLTNGLLQNRSLVWYFFDFLCADLSDIKWRSKTLPRYPEFLEEIPGGITEYCPELFPQLKKLRRHSQFIPISQGGKKSKLSGVSTSGFEASTSKAYFLAEETLTRQLISSNPDLQGPCPRKVIPERTADALSTCSNGPRMALQEHKSTHLEAHSEFRDCHRD